jgi:hypothetical protein
LDEIAALLEELYQKAAMSKWRCIREAPAEKS